MSNIYIYDDKGYYQGEIEKQAGVEYNNYLEEAPDFETNSPERYLAKVNLKTKVWEYEVKPEILQKEKEKLEEEKKQKEYEKLQKEEMIEETDSIVFKSTEKRC